MASNYSNNLFKDNQMLQNKLEQTKKEKEFEKLRADIAESEQQRLEKIIRVVRIPILSYIKVIKTA